MSCKLKSACGYDHCDLTECPKYEFEEENGLSRADILNRAKDCVCGKRDEEYGGPEDNFTVIAKLWSTYKGYEFTSLDVGMMMALLKIARVASGRIKDDNFVDLAGYAACAGEVAIKKG